MHMTGSIHTPVTPTRSFVEVVKGDAGRNPVEEIPNTKATNLGVKLILSLAGDEKG